MDELDDLLAQARRGSRWAFASFVRRTQPEIRRFCAHLAGEDAADDVTQETYLAAWRSLSSFRGDCSSRTWLYVIARRTAERVTRGRRRWVELASKVPAPAPLHDPAGTSEIAGLLAAIDVDRRTAIVLTQIVGLSYAEAAAVCECAVGTIRSRVARGREELLALMVSPRDTLERRKS